jgi:hypothetical protein
MPSSGAELDLRAAFTFVVRSPRWVRRLLIFAGCLAFFWLVIPYFLMVGYIIEISRTVRMGEAQLPLWNRRLGKMADGFKVTSALLLWLLPGALLSIPAGIVSGLQGDARGALPSGISAATAVMAGVGSVWALLVLVLEPPIIAQFLARGFIASLNPVAVFARVRVNVALTIVVGALVVVLTTLGLIGLAGVVLGVLLTFPYATCVGAYLVGTYAHLTDSALAVTAPDSGWLRPPAGRVARTPVPGADSPR